MYQAAQAYNKNALQAADPRSLEASALMHAAAKLQSVKDNWDDYKKNLDAALIWNQKLWSFLLTAATAESNPLPIQIKNNIANLAFFVFDHTNKIILEPKPERLNVLISINSNIAAGLRGYGTDGSKPANGAQAEETTRAA